MFYVQKRFHMYAGAGYRTRTCRVTSQDVPTAPQRHTFTETGITTIYTQQIGYFRRHMENYVLQEK